MKRTPRISQHAPAILGKEDAQQNGRDRAAAVELRLGASVVDMAPKAISGQRAPVIARGEGRRAVRFYNSGANPIFLGGAGVTSANSAIKILPGEGWTEDDAPDAQWFAVCLPAQTSTLRVQILQ